MWPPARGMIHRRRLSRAAGPRQKQAQPYRPCERALYGPRKRPYFSHIHTRTSYQEVERSRLHLRVGRRKAEDRRPRDLHRQTGRRSVVPRPPPRQCPQASRTSIERFARQDLRAEPTSPSFRYRQPGPQQHITVAAATPAETSTTARPYHQASPAPSVSMAMHTNERRPGRRMRRQCSALLAPTWPAQRWGAAAPGIRAGGS